MIYHAGALADYGGFFDHDREQKLAEATARLREAQALLDNAGYSHVLRGILSPSKVDVELAGCPSSSKSTDCAKARPRFFRHDPEVTGYVPSPGTNNGDLAWLKTKVAALLEEEDEE